MSEVSRASDGEERSGASAIELFFDLIFVFAVTRTSQVLQDQDPWHGVLMAAIAFVPVYWLWVGTTTFANLSDVETTRNRIVYLGLALSGIGMALALPDAFADGGLLFALAYWIGRVVLLLAVARHPHRWEFITFPVGAFLTAPPFASPGPW